MERANTFWEFGWENRPLLACSESGKNRAIWEQRLGTRSLACSESGKNRAIWESRRRSSACSDTAIWEQRLGEEDWRIQWRTLVHSTASYSSGGFVVAKWTRAVNDGGCCCWMRHLWARCLVWSRRLEKLAFLDEENRSWDWDLLNIYGFVFFVFIIAWPCLFSMIFVFFILFHFIYDFFFFFISISFVFGSGCLVGFERLDLVGCGVETGW